MPFCTSCGKSRAADAHFCRHCGAKVEAPLEPVAPRAEGQVAVATGGGSSVAPGAPPKPSAPSAPSAVQQPGAYKPPTGQPGAAQPGAYKPPAGAPPPAYSPPGGNPPAAVVPAKPVNQVAAVSTKIQVVQAGNKLHNGVRQYSFSISWNGQALMTTPYRDYDQLKESLKHLGSRYNIKFPGKTWLRNYDTNMKNVVKRAADLEVFLTNLLNKLGCEGAGLLDSQVHSGLSLTPNAIQQFRVIAGLRKAAADAARAAEAARLAAIAKMHRDDWTMAQNLNANMRVSGVAGAISSCTYPREQDFILRNRFWGFGDCDVTGPGNYAWFKMMRTNPSFFGDIFKNAHFFIANMNGEVMMSLQEQFAWMDYKFDLFRVDPVTNLRIPVCRVRRHWTPFSFTGNYSITLYGPMASHPPITCRGHWPASFTLYSGGKVGCTVDKKLFSWTDKYNVRIYPGEDVLLFMGIALAIDRIHHEVEEERSRRDG